MSKFLTISLFAFTFSFAATATPSWLAINTEAYSKDVAPSVNSTSYAAYYCTKEAAVSMFGGSSVDAVTTYLAGNFATGQTALQVNDAALRAGNNYVQTFAWDTYGKQYVFTDGFLDTLIVGEYLAVVLYQNGDDAAVRVFDNADWTGSNVAFDSKAGGTVGDWTAATVPEPTSGLLLLLGMAGLTLKRKRT